MFYLALAVLSSMLISVIMRVSNRYVRNNVTMLAFNYVMCTAMAMLFTGPTELFPRTEGLGLTLLMGAGTGVLYMAGFLLLQWNISRSGVTLPSTFMKLGVLVPTVMAIVVFNETPSVLQIVGVLMAVAAIVLIQAGPSGGERKGSAALVILLLCGGTSDSLSKCFEHWGNPALENHYLLYIFLAALALCFIVCLVKKQSVTWIDVLFGLMIGVPNYFSARFLLLSLSSVPAVVAYPTFSVGTIVLVTLAGVLVFREKLTRRQYLALGIILAALALLNI